MEKIHTFYNLTFFYQFSQNAKKCPRREKPNPEGGYPTAYKKVRRVIRFIPSRAFFKFLLFPGVEDVLHIVIIFQHIDEFVHVFDVFFIG